MTTGYNTTVSFGPYRPEAARFYAPYFPLVQVPRISFSAIRQYQIFGSCNQKQSTKEKVNWIQEGF